MLNLNVGILGHVDSGKTTIAKVLSQVASTAAFDKDPQSRERGITLDLGFSSFTVPTPEHLKPAGGGETVQFTLVDCPGHAKLIRTVIGGANIVDLILLVVDVKKGIQTQTAECVVIAEITCSRLIIVLNKIDLFEESVRCQRIEKMQKHLRKALSGTPFIDSPIIAISASTTSGETIGIAELIDKISENAFYPERYTDIPFVLAIDHCFTIKGKGTILTGTVLQGTVKVDDDIELAGKNIFSKVKSMEMFRQPVTSGAAGDRLGIRLTKFDSKLVERGIACKTGYASYIYCGIISVNKIKYFKGDVNSKSKFSVTIGYETVTASITCFSCTNDDFNFDHQYRYMDKLGDVTESFDTEYLLLQFERPVLVVENSKVIGIKLDMDKYSNNCRLAFWGFLISSCKDKDFSRNYLNKLKIYKEKSKTGVVDRIVNENTAIVKSMFRKETNLEFYRNLEVKLSTGEVGKIEGSFGQRGKVKVYISNGIVNFDVKSKKCGVPIAVTLLYKKYIFSTNNKIVQ